MLQRCRFISAVVSSAAVLSFASTAAAQNHAQFSRLEEVIRAEMASEGVPGAAISVVSGDRVLFAKAFGVSSIEDGPPVTTDMLFRIGPVTRVFTSAAMLVLEEEKRIDMNAPIRERISSVPSALLEITPHQLLSETAGFRAAEFTPGSRDDMAIGKTLSSLDEKDLFTTPGTVYSQSALGYALAAAVAEIAAAGPFADIVKSRVLDPIGMRNSTFRTTTAITRLFALGHTTGRERAAAVLRPFPENTVFAPAELMFSSVNDLARFAIAFMSGGQIDGRNALTPAVIAKMSGRYAPVPSEGPDVSAGYGLFSRMHRGARLLEQYGSTPGFSAFLRMAPDHQFAVIVLANREDVSFDRTIETATELVLPLAPAAPAKAASPNVTPADRQQLPGRYGNGNTMFQVIEEPNGLALVWSGATQRLEKIDDVRFAAITKPNHNTGFAFVRAPNGRVAYLHVAGRAYARLP